MEPLQFKQYVEDQGISVNNGQLEQFAAYYALLVEWNKKMNLTAITDKEEVYEKHFFDSVAATFFFDFSRAHSLIDIGAGAGFPSLPIRILFPELKITIVDSLNKRITFLHHVCEQLGLKNVVAIHGRAEELGVNPTYREQFDIVTARAVAKLSVLAEYCLPFVKVGGSFVVLKGSVASKELDEAKKAIKILGAKTKKVESLRLPTDQAERNIIYIDKLSATPSGFPRKAGTPAKNPIS